MLTDAQYWGRYWAMVGCVLLWLAIKTITHYNLHVLPPEPYVCIGAIEFRLFPVPEGQYSLVTHTSSADPVFAQLLSHGIFSTGDSAVGMMGITVRRSQARKALTIVEATAKEHSLYFRRAENLDKIFAEIPEK